MVEESAGKRIKRAYDAARSIGRKLSKNGNSSVNLNDHVQEHVASIMCQFQIEDISTEQKLYATVIEAYDEECELADPERCRDDKFVRLTSCNERYAWAKPHEMIAVCEAD